MSDFERMVTVYVIGGLNITEISESTPIYPEMNDALTILDFLDIELEYHCIYKTEIDFTKDLTTVSFEGSAILVLSQSISVFERVY